MSLYMPDGNDLGGIEEYLRETLSELRQMPGSPEVEANIDLTQRMLSEMADIKDKAEFAELLAALSGKFGILLPFNEDKEVNKGHFGFVTPEEDESQPDTPRRRKIGFN